jgi:hypothetical protein
MSWWLLLFRPGSGDAPPVAEGEFCHKAIQASLIAFFDANFPLSTDAAYNAEPLDANGMTEWVEFAVNVYRRGPRRRGDKKIVGFSITVHCWAKVSTNLYRGREIADSVHGTLLHEYVTIRDYDNDAAEVGGANIFEPRIVDMTPDQQEDGEMVLQHFLVTVDGHAVEA